MCCSEAVLEPITHIGGSQATDLFVNHAGIGASVQGCVYSRFKPNSFIILTANGYCDCDSLLVCLPVCLFYRKIMLQIGFIISHKAESTYFSVFRKDELDHETRINFVSFWQYLHE